MQAVVRVFEGIEIHAGNGAGTIAWVDSRQVAEQFGKQHKAVLRAGRDLDCSDEFKRRNFALHNYLDDRGNTQPCYRLTRDGFTILAMGFTGKDAIRWKERYINAFNLMEAELHRIAALPAQVGITRSEVEQIMQDSACDLWNAFDRRLRPVEESLNHVGAIGRSTHSLQREMFAALMLPRNLPHSLRSKPMDRRVIGLTKRERKYGKKAELDARIGDMYL